MSIAKILWVDDEIQLLKPHMLFLEKKDYAVKPCTNGADAVQLVSEEAFDIVLLDENMPGLSGLETLAQIKEKLPNLPIIMITKSEEEYIMEEAIGSKIADYLIKPVNPNQILLSLKKNLDTSRLVSEKTTSNYQQEFRKISMDLAMVNSYQDWIELYKKLIHWEIALESISDIGMTEILESQKAEANSQFFKFIKNNYKHWFDGDDKPILSHDLFKEVIAPKLSTDKGTLLVVLDNLRYDQLRVLEPIINEYYKTVEETTFFSILPTATQYARNAIFSGLTPLEMSKKHPNYWKNDTDEGGKNLYEDQFLTEQLKRL
ncbi:MAG: bifunctional response regulator/alkaline phosphatase family protein, partial [Flavobacteriaceae bacterium]|nr:bifunctional response regulator/alkaline phosphatase family protein [Flavobacteriaceae bacterium]